MDSEAPSSQVVGQWKETWQKHSQTPTCIGWGVRGTPPFATNEQPWYSSFPTPDLGPGRTVLFDGEKSVGPLG